MKFEYLTNSLFSKKYIDIGIIIELYFSTKHARVFSGEWRPQTHETMDCHIKRNLGNRNFFALRRKCMCRVWDGLLEYKEKYMHITSEYVWCKSALKKNTTNCI